MKNTTRLHIITPENTVYQMQLNCQLQQIAAKATGITYLEKPGRKQAEKALRQMVEMLDEN